MDVAQILKTKGESVVTTQPGTTIGEVARILHRERIGVVVVTEDDGSIAGLISERDIIRSLATHGAALLAMPVGELMTRSVVTCTSETTVDKLMKEMTERHIRHLPVVEHNRLLGIVSIGDVVKNRLDELESESSALRDFITRR